MGAAAGRSDGCPVRGMEEEADRAGGEARGEGMASPEDTGCHVPWTDTDEVEAAGEGVGRRGEGEGEGPRRRLGDGLEHEGHVGQRGLVHLRATWS